MQTAVKAILQQTQTDADRLTFGLRSQPVLGGRRKKPIKRSIYDLQWQNGKLIGCIFARSEWQRVVFEPERGAWREV